MRQNKKKHNHYQGLLVIVISAMLTSCIVIDTTEYPPDWERTIPFNNDDIKSLIGTYISKGDVVSDSYSMYAEYHYNLGYMLFPKDPSQDDWNVAINSDSVSFQISTGKNLIIKALIGAEPIDQMTLHRNDYAVTDGWLTIDSSRFVTGTAVAGIESRLNHIRLNEKGDLIMKSTASALAAVTIVPAIVSAEFWFRFENVKNNQVLRQVTDTKVTFFDPNESKHLIGRPVKFVKHTKLYEPDASLKSYGDRKFYAYQGETLKIVKTIPCRENRYKECWVLEHDRYGHGYIQADYKLLNKNTR